MTLAAVADALGGEKALGHRLATPLDLVEVGRRGVPRKTLTELAAHLDLSLRELAELLPVAERTLQRYKPEQHLSPVVSEHVLQLAEVVSRCREVFDDRHRFNTWLRQPSAALGGVEPLELLSSRYGIGIVLDELGRIEHGIPA